MIDSTLIQLLAQGSWETLQMVGLSLVFSTILGLPLGIVMVLTGKGHIAENAAVNSILSAVINIGRSVPFIILLVAIIPFTRLIVGTSIGTTAAIVPLTLAAAPFVARIVETSIKEVEWGVVEAAQAIGTTNLGIVTKVLLPEALPSIISGITITAINLVGYSAMAGAIGGGGLGDLAIRYGYQRFQVDVMIATVITLVAMVQLMQSLGDGLVRLVSRS
jgi:D-methionine transport system permease protein